MAMKRYEYSSVYPIDRAAVQAIAENMRQSGYDENFPILVKGDEIVDGYHRSEAARIAGVQPVYREVPDDWTDKDILRYVLRANGDRRHLDKGQRAAATILIKRRLGDEAPPVAELAAQAGVNESAINRFNSVDSDVLQDLVNGTITGIKAQQGSKGKGNGSRGGGTKAPKYTLSVKQQRAFASLGVAMEKAIGKIMAEAMDLGIASLESKYAANGN